MKKILLVVGIIALMVTPVLASCTQEEVNEAVNNEIKTAEDYKDLLLEQKSSNKYKTNILIERLGLSNFCYIKTWRALHKSDGFSEFTLQINGQKKPLANFKAVTINGGN